MKLAKTLENLGKIYLFFAGAIILIGLITIWKNEGFSGVTEVLNPFNIWNTGLTIATLAPGIALIVIANKIRKNQNVSR